MSEQTITAIYRDGMFQPTVPGKVTLPEGQRVKLSFEKIDEETEAERAVRVQRILDLFEHFYESLSKEEIEEMESAMRRRPNFFSEEEAEGA
jgi:predicted DNA-binding antitoxin AbrB/MazE fold protein